MGQVSISKDNYKQNNCKHIITEQILKIDYFQETSMPPKVMILISLIILFQKPWSMLRSNQSLFSYFLRKIRVIHDKIIFRYAILYLWPIKFLNWASNFKNSQINKEQSLAAIEQRRPLIKRYCWSEWILGSEKVFEYIPIYWERNIAIE